MTTHPTLTARDFAAKWRGVTTTENASAQSHIIRFWIRREFGHEGNP